MNTNDNTLKPGFKFRIVMEETEKVAKQMEEEFADVWDLMDDTDTYVWQLEPNFEQNNEQFFDEIFSYLQMSLRASPDQVPADLKEYQPKKEIIKLKFAGGAVFKRIPIDQVILCGRPVIDPARVINFSEEERYEKRIFSYESACVLDDF